MKYMNPHAEGYIAYIEGRGMAAGTIERTRHYLAKFFRWMEGKDVREITGVSIVDYIGFLRTRITERNRPLKPESIETELVTLNCFFEYLYKNEYIIANPMEGISSRIPGVKSERKVFSEEDISLFLDCIPTDTPSGQRDRAMFELMYSSGFRVGEIARLTLECLNLDERVCFIKQSKGKKDRYVPFSNTALAFVLKYLGDGRKKQGKWIRKSEIKEYVFLGRDGRLSWDIIWIRFRSYTAKCGLGAAGYTPHSIRHATATHLLAHGAGIRYVQELLGHTSLSTTQKYTRPGIENVKKMYRTYHPRENEFYVEMDDEYLEQVEKLNRDLARAKLNTAKRKEKRSLTK